MREYMKSCERATTIMVEEEEEAMGLSARKKMKLYSEFGSAYCGEVELKESSVSSMASRISDCSKHDESSDVVRKSVIPPDLETVDLQSEGYETEISTPINGIFSREATPTSELCGDSEQVLLMDSSYNSKKKSSPPPPAAENMPSAEELEEFFAAAEKNEQKRFAEKYNYDIVKDIPLEGRYQWVPLKH